MCVEDTDLLVAAPRPEPDTEPSEPLPLEPIDGLRITSLVDNSADLLTGDHGPAPRASLMAATFPALATHVQEAGEVPDVPLAEGPAPRDLADRARTAR